MEPASSPRVDGLIPHQYRAPRPSTPWLGERNLDRPLGRVGGGGSDEFSPVNRDQGLQCVCNHWCSIYRKLLACDATWVQEIHRRRLLHPCLTATFLHCTQCLLSGRLAQWLARLVYTESRQKDLSGKGPT